MSEFYAPAVGPRLGDPALDPPMTVRVEGGQVRAVRYSQAARRTVKTADLDEQPWFLVAGADDYVGPRWLSDDDVRTWPVVPAVVNEAAYARHHQQLTVTPTELVGDMGVESFRGER